MKRRSVPPNQPQNASGVVHAGYSAPDTGRGVIAATGAAQSTKIAAGRARRASILTRTDHTMKRFTQKALASLGLAACSGAVVRPVGTPLRSITFEESPHIVQRGSEYFLRYRMVVPKQAPYQMRRRVYTKKTPESAVYYFSVPTDPTRQRQLG